MNYVNVTFEKSVGKWKSFVIDRSGLVKGADGQLKRKEDWVFAERYDCPHLAAAAREVFLDENPDIKAARNTVAPEYMAAYWEQYRAAVAAKVASLKAEKAKYLTAIPGEEWADVFGYRGLYKVSSFGRVASVRPGGLKLIGSDTSLYPRVNLSKNGRTEMRYIHRLVAEAFVYNPFPLELTEVNHRDGDKQHNFANNLEWVTPAENVVHAIHDLRSHKALSDTTPVPVQDQFGTVYPSISAAAKATGAPQAAISAVLSPALPLKSTKGYRFTRVSEATADVQ